MVARFCPMCQRSVRAEDLRCSACGAGLPQEDTIPGAFDATPRRGMPDGVRGGNLFLPLTLREDAVAPPRRIDSAGAPVDLLIPTDPPAAPPAAAQSPHPSAKAEHRASVRRARMRQAATPDCTDVLVLDPDESTRKALCDLLAGFGFRLVLAADVELAAALAASRCLAAAFVDVSFDDSAGNGAVTLCRTLKAARRSPGGASTALVLVSARISPVDRIRADLAGVDAVIVKPARRGDVARALEACAVALPADARRS